MPTSDTRRPRRRADRRSSRCRGRAVRDVGKVLLGFGLLVVILGGFILIASKFTEKVPWIGRLPGDIYVERDGWSFYFPLATSIVISVVLTLIFWLFGRR